RAMAPRRAERCRNPSIASAIVETHVLGSTDRHLLTIHLDERKLRSIFGLDTHVPVALFRFRICRTSAVAQNGERISQSVATINPRAPCFDPI
ncbi:hypothetical protein ABTF68_20875, partial [Acinetobacter baumannii]